MISALSSPLPAVVCATAVLVLGLFLARTCRRRSFPFLELVSLRLTIVATLAVPAWYFLPPLLRELFSRSLTGLPAPVVPEGSSSAMPGLLLAGWSAFAFLALIRWVAVRAEEQKAWSLARPASLSTFAKARQLAARIGVRRPEILVSPEVCEPGFRFFPSRAVLLAEAPSEQAVPDPVPLAAALIRLAHRDHLWGFLAGAICVVFFFHPLAWMLHSRWRSATQQHSARALVQLMPRRAERMETLQEPAQVQELLPAPEEPRLLAQAG